MHELRGAPEPSFEEILARLAPCDLVLIEGYKREPIPKIEARRLEAARPRAPGAHRSAYRRHRRRSSGRRTPDLPVFDLDDTMAIADFIAERIGLSPVSR